VEIIDLLILAQYDGDDTPTPQWVRPYEYGLFFGALALIAFAILCGMIRDRIKQRGKYKCEGCGKGFVSKNQLFKHLKEFPDCVVSNAGEQTG